MALGLNKNTGEKKVKNWYLDRYEFVVVQRNILALIAVLSLLATSAAVFAVAVLTKAKTFEPFVIEIEKKTGITSTINRNSIEEYTANEILRKYFLVGFVRAREGYDATDFQYSLYRVIRTMSVSDVYYQAKQYFDPKVNDQSPLKVLSNGEKRLVRIKSISFLDREKKKAQIRFATDTIARAGNVTSTADKIAIIDFDFAPELKLQDEDRYVNPLGFLVKSYRVDNDKA